MDYGIVAYCDIVSNVDWQTSADVDRAVFLDVGFPRRLRLARHPRGLRCSIARSCRDQLLHHR